MLFFVDTITRISLEPDKGTVDAAQDIVCAVETTKNLTSVMINWLKNNVTIVADERITVNHTVQNKTILTIVHFDYLMEGDEGTYTCNIIIDGNSESASTVLQNLIGKQAHNTMCFFYGEESTN